VECHFYGDVNACALSIPYNDSTVNEGALSFPVSTESGSLVVTAAMLNFKLSND